MKTVTLFRIKTNAAGGIPSGFQEGQIVGCTDEELTTLKKNPALHECFEEIQIKQRTAYADPKPTPDTETASDTKATLPS